MGLFDFVKSVGKKIFGGSEDAAAPGDALKAEAASHGFDVSGLDITTDGNNVSVTGSAASQEEVERILLSIGNTIGVSNITSNLAVNNAGTESVFYTVVKGDSLWKIAEKHYGKGKGGDYTKILEANMPPIEDEDLIQPGWVLRIPKH
jgi:nucleoid-associated protein YgaU